MIVEKITITDTQLNTALDVVKLISDPPLIQRSTGISGNKPYAPYRIRLDNQSGADFEIIFLTNEEKEAYDIDSGITDKFLVKNTYFEEYNVRGDITTIIVVGTSASHTADLDIYIIKE